MLDLYPIKNRLGKIKPGVWRYSHVDEVIRKALGDAEANAMWFEDADLIARAPCDLRALVEEVETLRLVEKALSGQVSMMREAIAHHQESIFPGDEREADCELWTVLDA